MKKVANIWIELAENVPDEDLREYLADAVIIDLDVENEGKLGIESIEIDWDSLRDG